MIPTFLLMWLLQFVLQENSGRSVDRTVEPLTVNRPFQLAHTVLLQDLLKYSNLTWFDV